MRKRKIFRWVRIAMLFMAIVLLNNCKEPIKLDAKIQGGVLAINGKVSTLNEELQVRLGYTSPDGRIPTPASGATVTLFSSDGESWPYAEFLPGSYMIDDSIVTTKPGTAYYIEISVAGKMYRSEPEIVPVATGEDQAYFEFEAKSEVENNTIVKRDVVNVFTDTDLPPSPTPQYFKWDVEEYYMFEQTPRINPFTGRLPLPCFVLGPADPQRVSIFTTENLDATHHITRNLVAVRTIDQSFLAKHWFIVKLSSLTPKSYSYWKNVNALANRGGSIFDTPPALIRGNIHNVEDETEIVHGYFEATNTSLKRFYVLRGDVPFPMPFYCNDPIKGVYSDDYPPECSNCLSLPGSTHLPPDWFF